MLPIHPKPLDNELLSSWVTRLALSNGLYLHEFVNGLLDYSYPLFTRDMDRLIIPNLVEILSLQTGFSKNTISNMQLFSFEGQLFNSLNHIGNTRWILPLGIYHRKRTDNGVLYCPLCLKTDKVKFIRKTWRLSCLVICPIHNCILHDSCPHCESTIDYLRLGIGKREFQLPPSELGVCHQCSDPIWNVKPEYLSKEQAILSYPYLNFINSFPLINKLGDRLNLALDIQFFDGIWHLANRIVGKRSAELRQNIYKSTGICLRGINNAVSFDFLSLNERLNVLIVVFWILDDWPDRLIYLSKETKFSLSVLGGTHTAVPYWIYSIFYKKLNLSQYIYTDEEVLNSISVIKQLNQPVTPKSLSSILGLHISTCAVKLHKLRNKK